MTAIMLLSVAEKYEGVFASSGMMFMQNLGYVDWFIGYLGNRHRMDMLVP
jgi:hypothetical protein